MANHSNLHSCLGIKPAKRKEKQCLRIYCIPYQSSQSPKMSNNSFSFKVSQYVFRLKERGNCQITFGFSVLFPLCSSYLRCPLPSENHHSCQRLICEIILRCIL